MEAKYHQMSVIKCMLYYKAHNLSLKLTYYHLIV